MSLKDTLQGARNEINDNLSETQSKKEETTAPSNSGFVRKSAARGKPSRKAAAGVRVVKANGKPKSKVGQSKEAQKAERKHEREVSDQRYTVSQMYLDNNPEYKARRKVWWRFLIVGIVLMLIAFGLYTAVANQGATAPQWMAILSMATMVIAYAVVIAGIIYDWKKIRPMRKESDKKAASMSEKRLRNVLERGSVK
ncbi:MAG: hypothetical protein Q4B54_08960 [Coriobacteriales bacterium]|nr:hypothetical protein [Coriobacteriales bacterium]